MGLLAWVPKTKPSSSVWHAPSAPPCVIYVLMSMLLLFQMVALPPARCGQKGIQRHLRETRIALEYLEKYIGDQGCAAGLSLTQADSESGCWPSSGFRSSAVLPPGKGCAARDFGARRTLARTRSARCWVRPRTQLWRRLATRCAAGR